MVKEENNAKVLDLAQRHISESWMSISEEVFSKVKTRLDDGTYKYERRKLIEDLKCDVGLFLYCLRELGGLKIQIGLHTPCSQIISRMAAPSRKLDPIEILEQIDLKRLRNILPALSREVSKHSVGKMTYHQALRLREAVVSASAAELIARSLKVDGDLAFACTLLRQLGITLSAWNYPGAYSGIVDNLQPEHSLEQALARVLDVSPAELSKVLVQNWDFADDVVAAVAAPLKTSVKDSFARVEQVSASIESSKLSRLVASSQLGELYSYILSPERYTFVLEEWEHVKKEIFTCLGVDAFTQIHELSSKYLKGYAKYFPEVLEFPTLQDLDYRIINARYAVRLLEQHKHLHKLPDDLQCEIRRLYSKLKPNKILKSNIETLMRKIIPKAGFEAGCLFMYEPKKEQLSPAIKIGGVASENASARKVNSELAQSDLVISSFRLNAPLQGNVQSKSGEDAVAIAGALGAQKQVGVLYLETKNGMKSNKYECDPIIVYRTLQRCVSDCFNIS